MFNFDKLSQLHALPGDRQARLGALLSRMIESNAISDESPSLMIQR